MKLFLFLFNLFVFSSAFAAKYDYKKYWTREDLKNSQVKVSVYTKDSPLEYLKNIATLTVSQNNKDSYETVVGFFKRSVGTKKWSDQKIDGLEIHESYEPDSNTLYRLAFNKKTKQFSVGSVKLRYLLPSYLEMHMLQVEKLTKKSSKSTATMLYDFILPKAFADDAIGGLIQSLGLTINNGFNNSGVANGLNNVSDSVNGFRSTANNAVGSVNNVAGSINNAAGSANNVAGSINNASGSVDNLASSVRESNQTARDMMSPANVAKLAAVGTLTSIAVSSLVTFAAQGTWELAKRAYFEIKGEFSPAEADARIKNFEYSLSSFQKLSPNLIQLNTQLTILAAATSSLSRLPAEAALAQVDADLIRARQSETAASVSVLGCADCMGERLIEIKKLEEMKRIIQMAGGNVEDAKRMSCENLDSVYETWVATERQLNQARAGIIRDARVFMGLVSSTSDINFSSQEQRKQNNACTAAAESRIKKLSFADREQCDADPYSTRSTCITLRAAKKEISSCEIASTALVTEDHQANLSESAAKFNENIADLSSQLSTLDCSLSRAGTCLVPGPYKEMQSKIQTKLTSVYSQCPDRRFAKSVSREVIVKQKAMAETRAPEPRSVLSNFFGQFKTSNSAQNGANAYQSTVLGQGDGP